jgi:hypothetical protein
VGSLAVGCEISASNGDVDSWVNEEAPVELSSPVDVPKLDELSLDDVSPVLPDDVRLRKAVTSPPVGTIATTSQPSADLSLSLVARLAGS